MRPFNLSEALSGKPLITRDGDRVTSFIALNDGDEVMPYKAILEGGFSFYYTAKGEANGYDGLPIDEVTLFIADDSEDPGKEVTA